jgi:hypothetical protein
MGSDFEARAKKTLKRSWNGGSSEIATADLLTQQPSCAGRSFAAVIVDGTQMVTGETVTVEMEGGALIVRRDMSIIARFENSGGALAELVAASFNIRPGTIDQVHDTAGIVEISIC